MRLQKRFDVKQPTAVAARILARDDTLAHLFPDARTEIVESEGNRRTIRTYYRAMGRDGVATFHFTFHDDGSVEFEKVCDGNVWRELTGTVKIGKHSEGTRVTIEMNGRTKALVPELAIRGPMREQIDQKAYALRERIQEGET